MELGTREVREFWRFVKEGLQAKYAERIAKLQELLDRFDHQPTFWAMDVQKALERIVCALESSDFGLARDIVCPGDFKQHISLIRDCVYSYGQLVYAWSSIREAAKRLIAKDGSFRLSRIV
jgi:hypothetical protein